MHNSIILRNGLSEQHTIIGTEPRSTLIHEIALRNDAACQTYTLQTGNFLKTFLKLGTKRQRRV